METIYIEEIGSDDEGPPTPPQDGRHLPDDEHEEGIVLGSGQENDPEGVCSVLDPGQMVETKQPAAVGGGYVMAWRHMEFKDECRPRARGGHAAAGLSDTSLVIFGGADRTPQPFNDTFVMDVTADSWTAIDAANPPQHRSGHSLAAVDGRFLYVFGGQDYTTGSLLDDFHMLELGTEQPMWNQVNTTGAGPCARSSHSCQAINGQLYIFGGSNTEGGLMNDMHVFDTTTNTWSEVCADHLAPKPREMASSVVVGECIYIIGGRGVEGPLGCSAVFNTGLNQWVEHGVPTMDGRMAQAAAAVGNSVFVFGGASAAGITDQLLCLDTESQEWNQVNCPQGNLPSARFAHTLTTVASGLVVVGGIDPEKDMNDAHMLEVTNL
eukprot:TRINITY_DN13549_c0_g1_i1.p1 TRINITY_DN13549_c0_g1~~TRINITY_DN13549_c0_g1_i1.p1  ORF type:complete len:380 (-),score=67.37 TRINITY_DN13549_c0_g1_i1:103-1242(-)